MSAISSSGNSFMGEEVGEVTGGLNLIAVVPLVGVAHRYLTLQDYSSHIKTDADNKKKIGKGGRAEYGSAVHKLQKQKGLQKIPHYLVAIKDEMRQWK